MDKQQVISKLRAYKKLLAEHLDFEEMILLGSHARGSADEYSDVDVAVVVDTIPGDYFAVRPLLWKIRRQIDDRIEPILLERHHDESGFLTEIKNYGIPI